jgi:hypothetical protein
MKEDFLHYIWKNDFFDKNLYTTNAESVKVLFKGMQNFNSGPDFLEAKIMINDILWVGNVEIHKTSSDWYAHGHEKDPAYDNVILHVVYEDNMPVYNSNQMQIPTLVLSKFISKELIKNYNKLIKNKSILRCQNELKHVDKFTIINYKYKLFFERLENKYDIVKNLLQKTNNDWNRVLYETLLKYFGGIVNKDAFELLAQFLPYSVFKKQEDNLFQLEALLFGVSGLLKKSNTCSYYQSLKNEFEFLKEKYSLEILPDKMVKFHRLRPLNFPTIRLAQFAKLCYDKSNLFDILMQIKTPEEAYQIFDVSAGEYWDTHYNFDKLTKAKKKKIGKNFIDVILINVIIPLKFAYQKHKGIYNEEEIIGLIESIKPEQNRIITTFAKVKLPAKNALDSQAIIQLNENYCKKEKCLQCDVAHKILKNAHGEN